MDRYTQFQVRQMSVFASDFRDEDDREIVLQEYQESHKDETCFIEDVFAVYGKVSADSREERIGEFLVEQNALNVLARLTGVEAKTGEIVTV